MPKETKEQIKKNTTEKNPKKAVNTAKLSTKSSTKSTKKTSIASSKKNTTAKKSTANKVATTKKSATKTTTTRKKATKSTTNATTRKKPVKSTIAKTNTKKVVVPNVEYYDLPYRYNQTIVKILAQTPTTLFVYWDISDEDRENYKKTYGERFFEETKPVLVIHNSTMNYSFEVEINDFANSWYLHINDSKCNYNIELGRRPVSNEVKSKIDVDYIYISSSNVIEAPNNKILFNIDENKVYFRNVKTNITSTKSISFIKSMGKIYNIYDLYQTIYKEEILEDLESSTFK